MLENPDIYHLYTQEVQFDQTACPLVGSGILDTWIIQPRLFFVSFWTPRVYTYIYIYIYIFISTYLYIDTTTIFIYQTMTHPGSCVYWAVAKVELLDEEEAEQAKLSRLDAISCFYPKFILGFM